jgi:ribosomal protein L11 methyltransferase
MKVWTQITAKLPEVPEDWAVWAYLFEVHGFPGTVQVDWPPTLSAYAAPGEEDSLTALSQALQDRGAEVELSEVEEENWAESWKQYFKPKPVGKTWLIRPTWEEAPPLEGRREIVLDPGQAFGTGEHQTTRGCLVLLEGLNLEGAEVADIGCGSGILSIAARLAGASQVWGVDVESHAIEAAIENAARNESPCRFFTGLGFDPLPPDLQFDLVLSNIISAALISLASQVGGRVKPGGWWITSGVIAANWPDVLKAAEEAGFTLKDHVQEDDWISALFLR